MDCPRLDHFVRLQHNGKIGKCGHMTTSPEFNSLHDMQNSQWLKNIKKKFDNDQWPAECKRCQQTESINGRSLRKDMIERDKILRAFAKDYLVVGGVLDNICNSACQTCNANLSSKIGSITKQSITVNNYETFKTLPLDKIIELDINGGEPTYSPNYRKILRDPPPNVKIIRINTNAHSPFQRIVSLLERGIRVIVTVSFDGIGKIHDYIRWPIKFFDLQKTLKEYQEIKKSYPGLMRLNAWTTISVYNVCQVKEIFDYLKDNSLEHSFGILQSPNILSINHKNKLTIEAKKYYEESNSKELRELAKQIATGDDNSQMLRKYIKEQDIYRKINFSDYFNFDLNLL